MTILTIAAIALPLFVGFSIYLFPKLDRYLTLGVAIFSGAYGLQLLFNSSPLTLQLLDNFGVTLVADELSGYLILTNGLVTAAVILYCWGQGKSAFFYIQAIILHGSVNATFICGDLISLYVALEVLGIAAFLLIAYPRTDRSIWVALRYLFVSNTAMLFYLVGAVLVYQSNQSFSFIGISNAPSEAIALKWKHISKDCRQITFEQVLIRTNAGTKIRKGLKTQERRRFPCNDSLMSMLKSIKPKSPDPEELVFPSPEGKTIDLNNFRNRIWKKVLKELGIEYRKLYQTRHTFITHALEVGKLDAKDVARLVGKSPEVIYQHYAGNKRELFVPDF